jgi:ribosomal protein L7/L12
MALNMKQVHLENLQKIFSQSTDTLLLIKNLDAFGVLFDCGHLTITAKFNGKAYQTHSLNQNVTTLIKLAYSNSQDVVSARKYIAGWLEELAVTIGPLTANSPLIDKHLVYLTGLTSLQNKIPVIKIIRSINNMELKMAKDLVDTASPSNPVLVASCLNKHDADGIYLTLVQSGAVVYITDHIGNTVDFSPVQNFVPKQNSVKNKPVSDVIVLRDAKAIGQKVRGTSNGSIYHCIAYNDRVKIAARILKSTQTAVSFRVEWDGATIQEMEKLQQAGLSVKDKYMSLHLNLGDAPMGRVVGAFLIGLGIQFTELVTYEGDLVTEGVK